MKRALAFTLMVLAIMIIAVSCEEPQAQVHEHTYAEEWSHDDTFHWHASACGHEEEVSDKEVHKWKGGDEDGWIVDVDSTEKEQGKKHRECSVCGYKEEGKVPLKGHVHTFSAYDHTSDKHWRTCTSCGEKFTYTHTFSYVDAKELGHTPTCYCGYKKSNEDHVYTGTQKYISGSVWDICDRCAHQEQKEKTVDDTTGVATAGATAEVTSETYEKKTITVATASGGTESKTVEVNNTNVDIEVDSSAVRTADTENDDDEGKTTVTFPAGALKVKEGATSVSLIVESAPAAVASNANYAVTTSTKVEATKAVVAGFEFKLEGAVASDLFASDSTDATPKGTTVVTYIAKGLASSVASQESPNADITKTTLGDLISIEYIGSDKGKNPELVSYNNGTGKLEFTVYHFSKYAIISKTAVATDNLGTMYSDLSTALSALGTKNESKDIEKITLLKNIEVSSKISFSNKGTIDLNGKTITFVGSELETAIENTGDFTLVNGTIEYKNARNIVTDGTAKQYSVITNNSKLTTKNLKINVNVAATCCVSLGSSETEIKKAIDDPNSCPGVFVVHNTGTATFESSDLSLVVELAESEEQYAQNKFAGVKPIIIYQGEKAETNVIEKSSLTASSKVPGGVIGLYVAVYDLSNTSSSTTTKATIDNSTIKLTNNSLGWTRPIFAESYNKNRLVEITVTNSEIESKDQIKSSDIPSELSSVIKTEINRVYGLRAKGNSVIKFDNATTITVSADDADVKQFQYATDVEDSTEVTDENVCCGQIINTNTNTWYVNTEEGLNTAIEKVDNQNTIKLLENINLTKQLKIENEKAFTLDLNGKTVTNSEVWTEKTTDATNPSLINVSEENTNLTITGNGTVVANSSLNAGASDKTALADENLLFAIEVFGKANVTIIDGTFTGDGDCIYVKEGKAKIKGGEFSLKNDWNEEEKKGRFLLNCDDTNLKSGTAEIIVSGGTFVDFNPAKGNGGTYEQSSFVDKEYQVSSSEKDGNTVYEVHKYGDWSFTLGAEKSTRTCTECGAVEETDRLIQIEWKDEMMKKTEGTTTYRTSDVVEDGSYIDSSGVFHGTLKQIDDKSFTAFWGKDNTKTTRSYYVCYDLKINALTAGTDPTNGTYLIFVKTHNDETKTITEYGTGKTRTWCSVLGSTDTVAKSYKIKYYLVSGNYEKVYSTVVEDVEAIPEKYKSLIKDENLVGTFSIADNVTFETTGNN